MSREALRDDLDAIVRTAKVMAIDNPGLESKFALPRGKGDQALLNAARAFAQDAEPLAKEFIAHHMPKDFLDDLGADITAFDEAIRDRETASSGAAAARANIESAMQAALDAVRRLDGLVPNRLRDEPATLTAWQRARHVEYARNAKAGAPSGSVPSAGPAPLGQ